MARYFFQVTHANGDFRRDLPPEWNHLDKKQRRQVQNEVRKNYLDQGYLDVRVELTYE
jgi:hypothetical protein